MKGITKKILAIICVMFLAATSMLTFQNVYTVKAAQKFKIHFIDVGCGDGALLQYGEGKTAKYALIDAGAEMYNETTDKTYAKKSTPVYNYLKKTGVKHLEFVILTHPHGDHIGGMASILNDSSIKIDKIYGNNLKFEYLKSDTDKQKQSSETAKWTTYDSKCYKKFKKALEKRNKSEDQNLQIQYIVPKEGDVIYLGNVKILFYGTLKDDYQYARQVDLNTRQVNKYSIVTKIIYGQNSFLMAGDAQKETIQKIIKRGYDLSAQVLKEPHHGFQDVREQDKKGTNYSSDHKLLIDKSKASIAIISNGYKNVENVPLPATLKDLSKQNVYKTSDRGTIVVTSDGKKLSIQTQKGKNQPSLVGKIASSGKTTSSSILSSMNINTNTKKKINPIEVTTKNKSKVYENKKVKMRFSATARSFTSLNNIQYKFVKRGYSEGKISYKTGNYLKINNGMDGTVYIRYNTALGSKTVKLPEIIVDEKVPTKAKIVKQKNKIYKFQADYGISGKGKTQYKLVPKGKKASKCRWITANSLKYQRKYKRSKLYVRFIDKAGNITVKKTTM